MLLSLVGLVRRSWKNRQKPTGWLVAAAVFAWLLPRPAGAQARHVENRCARLSGSDYEELDARVQLLLRSDGSTRPLPAVVCDRDRAWVEWEGQRFSIRGRGSLVDEAVDVIEAQLHEAGRVAEADPRTTENSAVEAGEPVLQGSGAPAPAPPVVGRRADPVALRASDARGGGIAVGIETELPSDTVSATTGPAFDFGGVVGPLLIGGREAFRFGIGKRSVLFMDFEASIAYGAPLNPDRVLGVVARFGAEWMVAYPEGNSGQAAVAPVASLGLRAAKSFGFLSLWGGFDARFRLSRLSLRSQNSLIANDVGGSVTVGVAFVDWSRK
jgi:hypothetical protein